MDQTINFGMNNFQNVNNNINQINNANVYNNLILNQYNQNNPMMNQMTNYNQDNPMLNQMTNIIQDNPLLNQMNTFNQNNPILNQMNIMLNQMNTILNQMNAMLNQINLYDQSNPILYRDIICMNEMVNKINEKMKEINEKMKKMNQINQIQNINLNNLNKNQMELINSIIQFYKENGNEYMNFDYPYQIKNIIYFLSLNYKLDISDKKEDPLYYIKEPKKMIKFINSDYKEYKVSIPLSITKYDLYSIAQKYKCFKNNDKHLSGNHSNILLINNNLILKRDETSIECINENNIVIIIEPRNFPDDSYYKSLKERTEMKGNITFNSRKKISRIFPEDIKIYEIYKSINLEFGLDIYTYKILANGESLKIDDQREGSFLFNLPRIYIDEREVFYRNRFGKIVIATFKYKNIEIENTKKLIGLLDSVKDIKEDVENIIQKKIKKIEIGNKVIERDDIRNLFSLGINNDFICSVEFEV